MKLLLTLAILIILDALFIWQFIQSERRRERRETKEMINEIFNTKKETV